MTINIAINGFGRIGRMVTRALLESKQHSTLRLVAINDLCDIKTLAHLLQYDSIHGPCNQEIIAHDQSIEIDGHDVPIFSERNPEHLPWKALNIDIVFECTGLFCSRHGAEKHLLAGSKKVLISAPAGTDIDATIVYGVNDHTLTGAETIVSNASCTTNCLAPLIAPLHKQLGIQRGLMTTVHAFTNDQNLHDGPHKDLWRARGATQSMIPTKTGAASAIGLVIPELAGKLDGLAIRIPTPNVSLVDLTFQCQRQTHVDEVNAIMLAASQTSRKNILRYNKQPLVSMDFNHNPASSVFDATQTRVIDDLVKVLAWYDNEWGFSNRMLDTTEVLFQEGKKPQATKHEMPN